MKQRQCQGCGILLQTEDENKPGFVPAASWDREDLLCRRCFRLLHYGQVEAVALSPDDYLAIVADAVARADLLLVMMDVVDFEGSFDEVLLKVIDRPFLVAVNKMDLLPRIVPWKEAEDWVSHRFSTAGLEPRACVGISSKEGKGINRLRSELWQAPGSTIAVIGVTNTGKSTLLARLVGRDPTVSELAGTTLGAMEYQLASRDGQRELTIVDTPGLVPTGRLSDLLCSDCQRAFVPHRPLSSRLFPVEVGQSLLLSQYCQIDFLGTLPGEVQTENKQGQSLVAAYAPKDVVIHRTRQRKAEQLRTETDTPSIFGSRCALCLPETAGLKWQTQEVDLPRGWDLAVAGLGWVTAKGAGLRLQVTVPDSVKVLTRVNLVGRKDTPVPQG
ncbi:MAG: hypothetical protein GX030_10405 [Firmicutes bacterium]|nr:hypothetical protein [Bacillota bacterium]